jgi:hypothetical protein
MWRHVVVSFLLAPPMRTFPKSLATFRKLVDERGESLQILAHGQLKQLAVEPNEQLIVDSRPATIGIIVQPQADGNLRVVIQGFMKARFIPGKHVALDGFYKLPDGTVSTMSDEEFYEFRYIGIFFQTYLTNSVSRN